MGKGSGKGSGGGGYYLRGGHAATLETLSVSARHDVAYRLPKPSHHSSSNSSSSNNNTASDLLYRKPWKPKGLLNVGNTCYANAALQCLLSTALTHALLDPKASAIFRRYSSNPNLLEQGSGSVDSHESNDNNNNAEAQKLARRLKEREDKRMQENCRWLSRELKMITLDYLRTEVTPPTLVEYLSGSVPHPVVDPGSLTKYPDRLSKCLRPYQQEDAHEFLRAMLSTLVMNGQNKQLSSLFDGLLESAVTCLHCRRPSLTRDRYMDLSLDICQPAVETLTDALDEFTKTETLSGDNKVYCTKCETKRVATKGLRLATAPSILVCHLKRFAFDPYGRLVRLSKHVHFPLRLEIGDYMSRVNKARPPPYELVAVLVHQGQTCDSGHYLAYVKNDGEWYKCNDSDVRRVDVETVLSQQAYILVYEVEEMRAKNGYSSPGGATNNKSWRNVSSSASRSHQCGTLWRESFLGTALCGLDDSLLRDFCWDVNCKQQPHQQRSDDTSRNGRRRRKRRSTTTATATGSTTTNRSSGDNGTVGSSYCDTNSYQNHNNNNNGAHDDLSTLGESTVESGDTSNLPFRRISSSDNFKSMERYRQASGRTPTVSAHYPFSPDYHCGSRTTALPSTDSSDWAALAPPPPPTISSSHHQQQQYPPSPPLTTKSCPRGTSGPLPRSSFRELPPRPEPVSSKTTNRRAYSSPGGVVYDML